ncbi:Sec-independent protein translocase protein TatB [Cronobacter turicensis]
MFDIGFGELLLVFVIGLIVLGPQRLPVAVRTVAGWVRALRSLATTVQNELTQELKLQEFQESLKKVEKASVDNLTPELKASMDELREAAESMKRSYSVNDPEKASDDAHTIHNPLIKGNEAQHEGVTPAKAEHQAHSPAQKPEVSPAAESDAAQPATSANSEPANIVEASPDAPASVRKPDAASTVSDKP